MWLQGAAEIVQMSVRDAERAGRREACIMLKEAVEEGEFHEHLIHVLQKVADELSRRCCKHKMRRR